MARELPLSGKWLKTAAEIGIRSVGPKQVVKTVQATLQQAGFSLEERSYYLIGVGKAADAHVKNWMSKGPEPLDYRVFGVRGYGDGQIIKRFGGNHPVPGPESYRAGLALVNWIDTFEPHLPVLVFMSGGGSSALEHPAVGFSPADISNASESLLAMGLDIETMNKVRSQWSALKCGGALQMLKRRRVVLCVHSDVPENSETLVSSGPFDPGPYPPSGTATSVFAELFPGKPWQERDDQTDDWHGLRILAGNNLTAIEAIRHAIGRDQFSAECYPEGLNGPVEDVASMIVETSESSNSDVLIFGGEPTVELPAECGAGGRMGRLALAYGLADRSGPAYPMIAVATDGVDGSSQGAGAFWLPGPFHRQAAERAYDEFDSDYFFGKMGWLVKLPPTRANVRDLVVVLKNPAKLHAD